MDEDAWDNRVITITILEDDWKMLTEHEQDALFEKVVDLAHDYMSEKLNTRDHGHDKPAGCYGCNVCVGAHLEHMKWVDSFDLP